MIIFLIILLSICIMLLAGTTWLLMKVVRRNENLTFELEDRDRAAFSDIQVMFNLMEERDNALANLEMVLSSESKEVRDMTTALELVLSD